MSETFPTPLLRPRPGSIWQHHSGRLYTVLYIANQLGSVTYPETVVYIGPTAAHGAAAVWAGPLSNWHRGMTLIQDNNHE